MSPKKRIQYFLATSWLLGRDRLDRSHARIRRQIGISVWRFTQKALEIRKQQDGDCSSMGV